MIISLLMGAVFITNVGAVQPVKTGFSDQTKAYNFHGKSIVEWVK